MEKSKKEDSDQMAKLQSDELTKIKIIPQWTIILINKFLLLSFDKIVHHCV